MCRKSFDNHSARDLFSEYRKVIVDSLLEDFMGIHCNLGAGDFLLTKNQLQNIPNIVGIL